MNDLRILFVLALTLIAALPAAADEKTDAKQHYETGAAAYERGEYALARTEFTAAWELSHNAVILFDLARVETKLGHEEQAISYLREYLKEMPDAVDAVSVRTEIEARENTLAERRARAEAERRAEGMRAAADAQRLAAERSAHEGEQKRRGRLRIVGWTLFGAGLAAVAGGIACGVLAEHDASSVSNGGAVDNQTPPSFSSTTASSASEGALTAPLGIALDVVGGAMAATGIGLLVWTRAGAPSAHARLAPSGRGLVLAGSF